MKASTEKLISDILSDAEQIEDPAERAGILMSTTHGFSPEVAAALLDAAYELIEAIEDPRQKIQLRAQLNPHVARVEGQITKQQG